MKQIIRETVLFVCSGCPNAISRWSARCTTKFTRMCDALLFEIIFQILVLCLQKFAGRYRVVSERFALVFFQNFVKIFERIELVAAI
jgi:hypothetical protein